MSDEKFRKYFTDEEWETMKETVPWTRFVKAGTIETFHGEKSEMVSMLKAHKDAFVLKPYVGHGGFGITIGRDVDRKTWETAVDEAAAPKHNFAVQEFVKIPVDRFPIVENDAYTGFHPRNVNINFWSHAGEFVGAFLRAATGNIINVHQGGGLVPYSSSAKNNWTEFYRPVLIRIGPSRMPAMYSRTGADCFQDSVNETSDQ